MQLELYLAETASLVAQQKYLLITDFLISETL
jgi:hypothetical protein